jgi:transposase InsO family protein
MDTVRNARLTRTGAGWLYVATVLDLYARNVVGWAMAPSMPAKLVGDALNMAIQQRRPAPGLIVHHAEAKADIMDYIVGFYNCKRINSALGKTACQTPSDGRLA